MIENTSKVDGHGIYLGAVGWLEEVRPAAKPVPADLSNIPASLHDPEKDGPVFQQLDNGGFIHGPSLNHAATAAVLRSGYLSHFQSGKPEKMAVTLSSDRVRTALGFLEGIRNGQELGALLGYQFERGLHDHSGNLALDRFITAFRERYPLVADQITPSNQGEKIEHKEARNVLNGYALAEAVFLKKRAPNYPYDVEGLPAKSEIAEAIQAEVARLADTLDAILDLALAEGVYQATQGNLDRAGGMMKAITEGSSPPEPEIVNTPRGGTAITQRVLLHLETGLEPPADLISERAKMEPGLNKWLGDLLPSMDKIKYRVRLGDARKMEPQSLSSLDIQPIDLIYMIGDELPNATTELETRIVYFNREKKDDGLQVKIEFMPSGENDKTPPDEVTLFEVLPLLRSLRELVTGSRPLAANDFSLPAETTTNPQADANPKNYDLEELEKRVRNALGDPNRAFSGAAKKLGDAVPLDDNGKPELNKAEGLRLRDALRTLADFGVPDTFPLSTFVFDDTDPNVEERKLKAKGILLNQALLAKEIVARKQREAEKQKEAADDKASTEEDRTDKYRAAAQEIFGPAFNLIPVFALKNGSEVKTAVKFRDSPANGLTRHHKNNPHLIDEWMQGVSCVRAKISTLQTIKLFGEAFKRHTITLKPMQLPFRDTDHWVAMEYPEMKTEDRDDPKVFVPQGDFLSIVQTLPNSGFKPDPPETELFPPQSGLLVDEWTEVIPGMHETTGIAIHYNQPNSEPPQALLLAVTPEITGAWTWDKLVGILHDTLDRAKRRAVEPDQLGSTAYAHLLPAVVLPVAAHRGATIPTDFVHETAQYDTTPPDDDNDDDDNE